MMKNLKHSLALLLVLMMLFTTVFAEKISCMDGNTFTVTGVVSSAEVSVEDEFTLSVHIAADSGADVATLGGGGMIGWNVKYDADAFEIVGNAAYGYGIAGNTNDGLIEAGNYATQIEPTADIDFTSTAVAVYTFKVKADATEGEKSFALEGVSFSDADVDGCYAELENLTVVAPTITVKGEEEPPAPPVVEEVVATQVQGPSEEVTLGGNKYTGFYVFEGTTAAESFKLKAVYDGGENYLKFNGSETIAVSGLTTTGSGTVTFKAAVIGVPSNITITKLVIE